MQRKALNVTANDLKNATYRASYKEAHIKEYANNLIHDPMKAVRLEKQRCKTCYYGPAAIGGAAMTSKPCSCCGKVVRYSSTNTDMLCVDCAKEHQLCAHCGSDIETDSARTSWPEFLAPEQP